MQIKLSVIIPVYNLSGYLNGCVESIRKQYKFQDIEIILINDGSTDNSMHDCDSLAKLDARIKVYHTENRGVSAARNLGIQQARGMYITFIDGDDSVFDTFSDIISLLDPTNIDIEMLVFRSFLVDIGGRSQENYAFSNEWTSKCFVGRELFSSTGYFRGSVCGVVFQREFILKNQLSFIEGVRNSEDTIFMSFFYCLTRKIKFIDLSFYKVNKREGSASTICNREAVLNQAYSITKIANKVKSIDLIIREEPILNFLIYNLISNTFNRSLLIENDFSPNELTTIFKNSGLLPIHLDNIPIRRWKIRLLNFSVRLFYLFMKFAK